MVLIGTLNTNFSLEKCIVGDTSFKFVGCGAVSQAERVFDFSVAKSRNN